MVTFVLRRRTRVPTGSSGDQGAGVRAEASWLNADHHAGPQALSEIGWNPGMSVGKWNRQIPRPWRDPMSPAHRDRDDRTR